MGSQVIAICKCGVKKEILVGGGKFTYKEINYFPALCPNCYDLVQVNLKKGNLTCPICNSEGVIPYNSSKVVGTKGNKIVARSYNDVLSNGTHYCTRCESMELRFESTQLFWD